MPLVYIVEITDCDLSALSEIVARSPDWRQRQRAQTLLHLESGMSTLEVAQAVGIHVRTVSTTRRDWFLHGFESLVDAARCGAPQKLKKNQLDVLIELAKAEPLSAPALMARHRENGGEPIHLNTLKAALKRSGLVWKRTRHSLKKKG